MNNYQVWRKLNKYWLLYYLHKKAKCLHGSCTSKEKFIIVDNQKGPERSKALSSNLFWRIDLTLSPFSSIIRSGNVYLFYFSFHRHVVLPCVFTKFCFPSSFRPWKAVIIHGEKILRWRHKELIVRMIYIYKINLRFPCIFILIYQFKLINHFILIIHLNINRNNIFLNSKPWRIKRFFRSFQITVNRVKILAIFNNRRIIKKWI